MESMGLALLSLSCEQRVRRMRWSVARVEVGEIGGKRGGGGTAVVVRDGGSLIVVVAVMSEVAGALGRGWNRDIVMLDLHV